MVFSIKNFIVIHGFIVFLCLPCSLFAVEFNIFPFPFKAVVGDDDTGLNSEEGIMQARASIYFMRSRFKKNPSILENLSFSPVQINGLALSPPLMITSDSINPLAKSLFATSPPPVIEIYAHGLPGNRMLDWNKGKFKAKWKDVAQLIESCGLPKNYSGVISCKSCFSSDEFFGDKSCLARALSKNLSKRGYEQLIVQGFNGLVYNASIDVGDAQSMLSQIQATEANPAERFREVIYGRAAQLVTDPGGLISTSDFVAIDADDTHPFRLVAANAGTPGFASRRFRNGEELAYDAIPQEMRWLSQNIISIPQAEGFRDVDAESVQWAIEGGDNDSFFFVED